MVRLHISLAPGFSQVILSPGDKQNRFNGFRPQTVPDHISQECFKPD